MLKQEGPEMIVNQGLHRTPDIGGNKLVFGLGGKLGIGNLDRQHSREPFSAILAAQTNLSLFRES